MSFYMQSAGEEALQIGGAAALGTEDMAFTQYREPGILMWRDFGLQVCYITKHALLKPFTVPLVDVFRWHFTQYSDILVRKARMTCALNSYASARRYAESEMTIVPSVIFVLLHMRYFSCAAHTAGLQPH